MIQPKRISIVIPIYGRPERTRRMIECLRKQTINHWEAFLIGDNCPDFRNLMDQDWFKQWMKMEEWCHNTVYARNFTERYSGYGYAAINHAIYHATGKYFVFAGNDDMIDENHFEHYLSGIENTDNDFVYYNTWVDPEDFLRMSNLNYGGIGHSELIVRTDFLKQMPEHGSLYGHDWQLVQDMMTRTNKYKKVADDRPTYRIMGIKGKTRDKID